MKLSNTLSLQTERAISIKFSEKEKVEYAQLEEAARDLYHPIRAAGKCGKRYLRLTQALLPLRVACAGGPVPLFSPELETGEEGSDESEDDAPRKPKKTQVFSDFAFTSKLEVLVHELETIRDKSPEGKNELAFTSPVWESWYLTILKYPSQEPYFFTIWIDSGLAKS